MKQLISNCGLNCAECPAYIALKTNDDELRQKTAVEWSKMYKADIKPENVNCVGCLADEGTLFHHCTVCEIRACCRKKGHLSCAYCDDYKCKIISDFFGWVPEAEKVLDEVRAGL